VSVTERRSEFADYALARRPGLRRLAYALCGDWHAADDIVQSALARAYVAWPRIRRGGTEDAYVRRTITRLCIDESRRPWRRETPGLSGFDHPTRPGLDPGDRHDLITALMQLPEMQRRTVVLRHWLGLSVAETAGDLNISEGTVKSHTSRALDRLHDLMANSDEGTTR
jgi:RNA polymerase sigma-70 factor (sigma-E family)